VWGADPAPSRNLTLPQAVPHFEKSIAILQRLKTENELALAYTG